jgi:PAS domain S-box-containing protein
MRLRAKALLIAIVATIGTAAASQALVWVTLGASIDDVESAIAIRDLARAQQALGVETAELSATARYWGIWDDAYTFAHDRNPRFVESNLYGTVLEQAGIDVLLFIDPRCAVIHGTATAPGDAAAVAQAYAAARCPHGALDPAPVAESGFLRTADGVLLVSTQSILTSKREGPPRGVLLVGRAAGAALRARLRQVTRLEVDLEPLDDGPDAAAAPRVITHPHGYLAGEIAVRDLTGRPALLLRTHTARDVSAHARAVLWRMTVFLGVVGLAVAVIVILLLDGSVTRLTALLAAVRRVGKSRDLALRVPVRGRDEIAGLASEINQTLAALERAQAEVEGKEVRLRSLRQIVDLLPQLVFATDADGRLVLVNRALNDAFGVADVEILGRRADELVSRAPGLAVLLVDSPASGEQAIHARGQVRLLTVAKIPLDPAAGTGLSLLGVASDITEQRRLEEALRHSQKLDGIGRLAGGIAHDFNNLLAAILSCAHMAAEGLDERDPRREDIEEIRLAGERAAELTRHLLTFARRQRSELRVIDLNSLPAGMEKLFRRLLSEDIRLELALGEGLAPVAVDVGQMEQVLMNLVVNARDAMPGGGTIRISTRRVDAPELAALGLPAPIEAPAAELLVADTGHGMTAEVQARAFEPFFSTKEVGKGTGLGLATCYGIVKGLGGHIAVGSAPGRGTEVRILLPPGRAAAQPPAAPAERPLARGAETVLLVEDNELVRTSTARLLERQGYTVLAAADAAAALAIAAESETRIDVMIADVVLPAMSGPDLAVELLRRRPGTPVLFVSGYADEAIEQRTRGAAGGDLLRKPFTAAELAERLRAAIDRGG